MLLLFASIVRCSSEWLQGCSSNSYSRFNDLTFGYDITGNPILIMNGVSDNTYATRYIYYSYNGGISCTSLTVSSGVNYVSSGASITNTTTDYSNALFISVPQYNTVVYTSTSGTEWSEQNSALQEESIQRDIISGITDEGHEVWVAVSGGHTATYSYIMSWDRTSSPNTISFIPRITISNDYEAFRSVAYGELDGKKVFIVTGNYQDNTDTKYMCYYSYDGINWYHGPTMHNYGYNKVTYGYLTYAGGITKPAFVAADEDGAIDYLTSLDQEEWYVVSSSNTNININQQWADVTFGYTSNGVGIFMIMASNGNTYYSADLINWYSTDNMLSSSYTWTELAYGEYDGNRIFTAINSNSGRCLYYIQLIDVEVEYVEDPYPSLGNSGSKLSTGAIVGIVIACVVVIAGIIIGVVFGMKNMKRTRVRMRTYAGSK